ncbi:MAG: hypothetical protein HQ568_10100 [Calditrichaeota bacterium]|nr:hypothetical protein [Calditrichota bacterium]
MTGIPITPHEIIRRTKNMVQILEELRGSHLIVSGPEFFGDHHVYVDSELVHVIFAPKADFTTHVFIGDAVRAKEWRKYDKDHACILTKSLKKKSFEWKMYNDIVLYKGKMLPPKPMFAEPYFGLV